jgi:hypothetical protein
MAESEELRPETVSRDFEEIAHSGGKIIFNVTCDNEGHSVYQVTFTGSRPVPMRMFGVYALPQGIPVGYIRMGGINQAWNAPPYPNCIPVFIASDSQGYFGFQCPACNGYWRSDAPVEFCVYCGLNNETHTFLTDAHRRYAHHYAERLASGFDGIGPDQSREVVIDMDEIVDAAADVEKPDFYHPGISQQTQFSCKKCGVANDIRGRFGHCGGCGWRNNLEDLRALVISLRTELNGGRLSADEALKRAVSGFDACCRDFTRQLASLPMRGSRRSELLNVLFHRFEAREIIIRAFDIDLFEGMPDEEIRFVRRMLLRRHVFEHGGEWRQHDTSQKAGTHQSLRALSSERLAKASIDSLVA